LHYNNLQAALRGQVVTLPSYPTIRRYFQGQGLFQPKWKSAPANL
jgi:hypothetical protein